MIGVKDQLQSTKVLPRIRLNSRIFLFNLDSTTLKVKLTDFKDFFFNLMFEELFLNSWNFNIMTVVCMHTQCNKYIRLNFVIQCNRINVKFKRLSTQCIFDYLFLN